MRIPCVVLLSVAALLASGSAGQSSSEIVVDHLAITVIDGDSIQFNETVWQLSGIDAPELGQVCDHDGQMSGCGLNAAYELRKFISLAPKPLRCFPRTGTGSIKTLTCIIGSQDVALMMVQSGHAIVVPDGPVAYSEAENHAREASLGIWGSTFLAPWEWRRGHRLPREKQPRHDSQGIWDRLASDLSLVLRHGVVEASHCVVKGTVSDSGERLYYGPLDPRYADMTISGGRGERLFCSDDEARAAGWRREGERQADR